MSVSALCAAGSTTSTSIEDGMQLLGMLELGSALLNVLFAVYDVDDGINARRAGSTTSTKDTMMDRDNGVSARDEETFIQELANSFATALDEASTSFNEVMCIGAEDVFDETLVYLLALAIWEQAAVDDHLVAFAFQDNSPLPPVTRCQSITQKDRFFRLMTDGVDGLGDKISNRMFRVVSLFAKQGDIDMNREMFAARNHHPLPDRTPCQDVMDHPLFITLFSGVKEAYQQDLRTRLFGALRRSSYIKPITIVECVGCCDSFDERDCMEATCDHFFCSSCVVMLVKTSMKSESSFPLRCCKKPINPLAAHPYLDQALRSEFVAICFEFSTPPRQRVYCPSPSCSAFIGPEGLGEDVQCRACKILVCTRCRERAHPGDNCEQNQLAEKVKELAKEKNWQQCPRCHRFVEKTVGCNHISCLCGQDFCYSCGTPWKKCSC